MTDPERVTPGKTIRQMQAEVYAVNVEKGWRGPGVNEVSFGEAMALLHSEVSEALEAFRRWGLEDRTAVLVGHAAQFPDGAIMPKPEGVGSEFADILIRLLDDADLYGIDLEAEYERKIAFNRTRPYRHGGKAL